MLSYFHASMCNRWYMWFHVIPCDSLLPCYKVSMFPSFHALMLLPFLVSMSPCFHASEHPSIQAFIFPCFHASMLLYFLIPWFHTSMIPWFHHSMFSCFNDSMIPASMLSGLHVRQVRHLRFSISTNFKKCDWLTNSLTHRHNHLYICYRI